MVDVCGLQVRWLFNNEPVTSPHFRVGSRPDGITHTLHIPEVFDEDAGRFSVLAENDAGKATCSALLVVVDESQILPRDESPPETPLKRTAPLGFGPPPVVPAKQVRHVEENVLYVFLNSRHVFLQRAALQALY